MKTIFVTGAEGFAGRHLVRHLKSRGHEVVGGVRNRARKLVFEKQFGRAIVCEVSDAINVARAIASAKPDAVVHLAGTSQPSDAVDEPLAAYQSIVSAWANILDGVRRSVPRCKVLLVSACEVYGEAGASGNRLAEDAPARPVNTFGSLKAAAESIARTFYLNYHLDITIARPFHFIGAGQSEKFFFPSVARRLIEWDSSESGSQLALPDLSVKRDLVHVQDAVEAFEKLLESGKPNHTYNICSGTGYVVRDIVQMIARTAGVQVQITDQPVDDAPAIQNLIGSPARIQEHTGWTATRSIEDAVRSVVDGAKGVTQDAVANTSR